MSTTTRPTGRSAIHASGDPAATLSRLLDAELNWGPIASGGYISHLAMGLVAAERLGASAEQLERHFHVTTSGSFLIPRERPQEVIELSTEIERRGIDAVVTERLPSMVGHPGAQFLHAAIRLDLAIDSQHPGQVANALINWSDDAVPPEPDLAGHGDASFAEVMALVANGDRDHALDHLHGSDDLLDQISDWVTAVHDDPGDFGTLHYVPGTRAVRAVVGYLDDENRRTIERRLAQALVGFTDRFGFASPAGIDELDRRRATPVPDWDELGSLAVRSQDPHIIKLTYACRLEHERDGDPLHQWVAARQTGVA